MKIALSEALHTWRTDTEVRYGFIPLITAIVGAFLSILIGAFFVSWYVWLPIWIAMPLVAMMLPKILDPKGYSTLRFETRQALRKYFALEKTERKMLPANTVALLKTQDCEIRWTFENAYDRLMEIRSLPGSNVSEGREIMQASLQSITETANVYKESYS